MMRYAVVIEKAEGNYSAYVPDLPGCIAAAATVAEAEAESATRSASTSKGSRQTACPCRSRQASRNMWRLEAEALLVNLRRLPQRPTQLHSWGWLGYSESHFRQV